MAEAEGEAVTSYGAVSKRRSFALIFFFLAFAGCSKLSMAVRWSDSVVLSQTKKYFELNSTERGKAKELYRAALVQVQQQDFPQLADILDTWHVQVSQDKITQEDLTSSLEKASAILRSSWARFEPVAQWMVDVESKHEFKHFEKGLIAREKEEKERREKSPDQFRENMLEFFADETVGELTAEQRKKVLEHWQQHSLPHEVREKNRAHMIEKFRQARVQSEKRREFVAEFMRNWQSLQTVEMKNAQQRSLVRNATLMHLVVSTLTPDQKKRLLHNLKKRSEQLRDLAKEPV